MIKLLMLALAGFIFYSMISGLLRPRSKGPSRKEMNRSRQGETMVQDPQCGTYLPISDAIKGSIEGQQLYFCSKKCLKEYKKARKP